MKFDLKLPNNILEKVGLEGQTFGDKILFQNKSWKLKKYHRSWKKIVDENKNWRWMSNENGLSNVLPFTTSSICVWANQQ